MDIYELRFQCNGSGFVGQLAQTMEMCHRHTVLLRVNQTEPTEEVVLTCKLLTTSWNIIVFPH